MISPEIDNVVKVVVRPVPLCRVTNLKLIVIKSNDTFYIRFLLRFVVNDDNNMYKNESLKRIYCICHTRVIAPPVQNATKNCSNVISIDPYMK